MSEKCGGAWSATQTPQDRRFTLAQRLPPGPAAEQLEAPPEILRLLDDLRRAEIEWFAANPGCTLQRPYQPGETWPLVPTPPGPGFRLAMLTWEIGPGVRCRVLLAVEDSDSPAQRWLQ